MTPLVAAALVACVVLAGWRRHGAARVRLRRLAGVAAVPPLPRRFDPVRWTAVAAGVAVGLVVDGWLGIGVGLAAAIALDRSLRRLESRGARRDRLAAAADLPFAIDLLAATLQAGAPPAAAARAVGTTLGGPLGERLCQVAYALGLGTPAGEAWARLHGIPGAERLTAAAVRSSQSGAALSHALTRLADELRIARGLACEAAARRSGVLVVLPLGLCFLPAFVLAGLVPIVLSVLGQVMP